MAEYKVKPAGKSQMAVDFNLPECTYRRAEGRRAQALVRLVSA